MDQDDRGSPDRRDSKGWAGQALGGNRDGAATGRAKIRSAVRRVSGKPAAPSAEKDQTEAPRKKADRAAQATLGMMGKAPSSFDEAELAAWLGKLSEEQLKKLGKLVWAARQGKGEQSAGLGKIDRQMAQQGVRFEINGGQVTVNLAADGGGRPASSPQDRPWTPRSSKSYADWGRQWGRLKDFINGH